MKLLTGRLILRDISSDDLPAVVRHADDIEVGQYLLLMPHPYSEQDGKSFIELCKNAAAADPRTDYILGIERKDESGLIGVIGLHNIDIFQGTAQMGYWLGTAHWRNGFMSEAVDRMLRFAFNTLNLRRINIEAFVENQGSLKIIERAGFICEGTSRLKNRCLATGELHDVKFYGLLAKEWTGRNR